MSHPNATDVSPREHGFILVEVLVAMVLLVLLIGPLYSAARSAAHRAEAARERTEVIGAHREAEVADAWRWGAVVSSAWWTPGPTLHIRTEQPHLEAAVSPSEALIAGLWAGGWFLGEWRTDNAGAIQIGGPNWRDFTGADLVVRLHWEGGQWGPPWRLVVPGADGVVSPSQPGSAPPSLGTGAETVVHAPMLAAPSLKSVSESTPPPEALAPGLLYVVPGVGRSLNGLELDGRRQFWNMEEGRNVDVYF